MMERTLARRYASALLAAADKDGNVEEIESTLIALKEAYESNEPMRKALHQPKIPRRTRSALLQKPFEGRSGKTFLEFLNLLVEKNRVNLIPEIADAFDRLADASRGVVRVEVRSWKPLDADSRKTLEAKLVETTGRKVDLKVKVDPALKGGIAVTIGDTLIDGSVSYRLKELKEKLHALEKA